MNATSLLSLSGATLREGADAGNTAYAAELARRQAKREASGKVTVAALRSWGRTDDAKAVIAAAKPSVKVAKAKAAVVAKAAPAPAAAPAFTRAEVTVPAKGKKVTLTTRMDAVESALISLASAAASQDALLRAIVAKLA